MKISEITRRDIVDAIFAENISWSGRLGESEFLSRLFNLESLPSTDSRFENAVGDIWQHRVNNYDWTEDWVFDDPRFSLMNGDDDSFLAFLCETIHPIVRPDPTEAERICQLYNKYLRNDGFQIIEKTRLSGKPVFVGHYVGIAKLMQSTGIRISQRLDLINRIGRILQSRYAFTEIDLYLAAFKIYPPKDATRDSKWIYTKDALRDVPLDTIIKIAEDLGLEHEIHAAHGVSTAPRNWQDTNKFRLFISHIAKRKDLATRLRACLALYAISGFVAHEDIRPTLEWEKEIERALRTMDAFLSIHTPGFKDSFWTQQEIGFAVGRGVKIIPFKMGEDPTGFISKHQALPRRSRTAEEIAREVDAILADDPLTAGTLDSAK